MQNWASVPAPGPHRHRLLVAGAASGAQPAEGVHGDAERPGARRAGDARQRHLRRAGLGPRRRGRHPRGLRRRAHRRPAGRRQDHRAPGSAARRRVPTTHRPAEDRSTDGTSAESGATSPNLAARCCSFLAAVDRHVRPARRPRRHRLGEGPQRLEAASSASTCRAAPASPCRRRPPRARSPPEKLRQARSIIDQRVNATGVTEGEVTTQGGNQVIIEIPGSDESDIVDQVGRTAQLRFRLVWASTESAQKPADPAEVKKQDEAIAKVDWSKLTLDQIIKAETQGVESLPKEYVPGLNALNAQRRGLRLRQEEPPAGGPRRPAARHVRHQDRRGRRCSAPPSSRAPTSRAPAPSCRRARCPGSSPSSSRARARRRSTPSPRRSTSSSSRATTRPADSPSCSTARSSAHPPRTATSPTGRPRSPATSPPPRPRRWRTSSSTVRCR